MLSAPEQKVANHLKENRPEMYQDLVKAGSLEATVRRMWEEYTYQLAETITSLVVNQGLSRSQAYNQAEELCRELAFPPSESDQPRLGEDPSAKDPTTLMTTRSAKPTTSAKAASAPKPSKT